MPSFVLESLANIEVLSTNTNIVVQSLKTFKRIGLRELFFQAVNSGLVTCKFSFLYFDAQLVLKVFEIIFDFCQDASHKNTF